jgi:hypothetical protein
MGKKYKDVSDPVGQLVAYEKFNQLIIKKLPPFVNVTVRTNADDDGMRKLVANIRRSLEYKQYFRYLKHNTNMDIDTLLPFLTTRLNKNKHAASVQLELHHTPFKLVEVVRTICNKHIIDHGYAEEFDVGNEVMLLHYRNLIGLIPLTHTVHELVHNEQCDVCPNLVWGYWKTYIAEYFPYFDYVSKQKCEAMKDWELTAAPYRIPEVLKVKYSVIQCEGFPLWQHPVLDEHTYRNKAIDYIDDMSKIAS